MRGSQLKGLLCRTLKIEESELRKTVMVFFFYFFVIFSYYLIKPSKEALFIHYVGSDAMSLAFAIIPFATLIFLFFYDFLARKLDRRTFASLLLLFFVSNLIIIWIMFRAGLGKEAAFTLYVWSDVFSAGTVTQFWSITNDIYTSEGAKRVYGFLGLGAVLGGVMGSEITEKASHIMETENLLLFSAVFVVIIILIVIKVDAIARAQEKEEEKEIAERTDAETGPPPLRSRGAGRGLSELYKNFLLVMRSRYLLYFTLLLCSMIIGSKLIDFQLNRILEVAIPDKNGKTAYMADIYLWVNILSFVFLLFATFFYRYLGIFGTLLLAPSVNFLTILAFTLAPVLPYIVITKALDGGLKYGIGQVTREMLYIPCTKEEKYRAKAVIDILFYRLANVFTAGLILLFSSKLLLSPAHFNFVIIAVIVFTMWVLLKLKGAFIEGLGQKIEEAAEKHLEISGKDFQAPEHAENFSEERVIAMLMTIIRDSIPDGARFINAREAIEGELPALAPAGTSVYNNRHIGWALLIIAHLQSNRSLYSLAMQYLSVALPRKAWQIYSLILSDNSPVRKIRAFHMETEG
jgi:ATP:ADP antiporter, AAA family